MKKYISADDRFTKEEYDCIIYSIKTKEVQEYLCKNCGDKIYLPVPIGSEKNMKYKAFADGGCRPKNNRCKDSYGYCGFVIVDEDGNKVYSEKNDLGNYSTNNIAEFTSLKNLLKYISLNLPNEDITICMDSQLTVNVANKKWNLKDKNLITIYDEIMDLLDKTKIKIEWIPREKNLADKYTR